MKKLFPFILVFAFVSFGYAQKYTPVDEQSQVKFSIKNFGINTHGIFNGIQGNINFSFSNPENSSFNVSVNSNSINTGIDMRDEHLRKESYFNTEKFPLITIVSTKVQAVGGQEGSFVIFAKLSIKGTTKDISFPFKAVNQNGGIMFSGNFSINRKDFDIGGTSSLSNNVDLSLNVFAKKIG